MAKKVFLGIGHGGKDSGAVGNGLQEKDLNLTIALAAKDVLVEQGVDVKTSRAKDENDPLDDRIKECNSFVPDLALDIHNNAGGGDGAEVFYHYKGGTSKTLAENIASEIEKTGQNLRLGTSGKKDGLKVKLNDAGKDYFGFIRETVAPAVIVECAFLDNKTDIAIIDTEAEQKTMGIAIAKGILKTLDIAYVEEKKETPKVEEKTISFNELQSKLKSEGYTKIIL